PPHLHPFPTRPSSDLSPPPVNRLTSSATFCTIPKRHAPFGLRFVVCGLRRPYMSIDRRNFLALGAATAAAGAALPAAAAAPPPIDRKSTRLNSSHLGI